MRLATTKSRLFSTLAVSAAIMALSGCASAAKKLSDDSVSAIEQKKMGGIVLSLKPEKLKCQYGGLSVRNVKTGQTRSTSLLVVSWDAKRNIKMLSVPPGTYEMAGGNCQSQTPNGNFTYTSDSKFIGMEAAYSPFKVGAGEAVYPGTFIVRGRKADGPRYGITDLSQFKAEGLEKKYKSLSNRFVSRPVSVIGAADTGLRSQSGYINKN